MPEIIKPSRTVSVYFRETFQVVSMLNITSVIWGNVFKNGPSKICGRQSLKSSKWYGLFKQTIISFQITAQKMKLSIKDFFRKCDQILSFLRIWWHLLKRSLMENFTFCVVFYYTLIYCTSTSRSESLVLSISVLLFFCCTVSKRNAIFKRNMFTCC